MTYPLQREDAADWIRQQDAAARSLYTDANSGMLSQPNCALYPYQIADFPTTTSPTFSTLWIGSLTRDQPWLTLGGVVATDSATTGEARVLVNSAQFGAVVTVGALTAVTWAVDPAPHLAAYSSFSVEVQARRVSGAGSVRLGVSFCRLVPAS